MSRMFQQSMSFRRDQNLAVSMSEKWALPEAAASQAERLAVQASDILENMPEGVYGLDLDGYVAFCNPAAQRLTGWSIEDLQGRTQHSMVHHSHADGSEYPREDCPIYRAFRDGIVQRRDDEVFWRKDGTSFPVCYTSTPIFRGGSPVGAVVVFTDISQAVLRHAWETAIRNLLLDLIAGVPFEDAWTPVAESFAAYQRGYSLWLEPGLQLQALLRKPAVAQKDAVSSTELRVEGAMAGRLLLCGPPAPHRVALAEACLAEERETLRGALVLALRNARPND